MRNLPLQLLNNKNYFRLKESIETKDYQLSDIESNRLIDQNEKIGHNER